MACAPGGGGTLNIYWWGCAAAHPKRGVLGTGTTQKRGVLGTGTTQKRGVLGTGTSRKGGVLGTGTSRKRGVLRTGLVKKTILVTDVAQKEVLGAYLLITLTFSCQHDQLVGFYSDRLKNRGLRHGSGLKSGVLGTGQARKKGGLRHGSGQKRGVFTAAHTCTGHIWECPPPGLVPHTSFYCQPVTGSTQLNHIMYIISLLDSFKVGICKKSMSGFILLCPV